MSRIFQIVVILLSFAGGAAATWSFTKEGPTALRSTLEVMLSGEIESIARLADVKAAVQASPPSSSFPNAARLVDKEIARHVLLLGALRPKADKLKNRELTVLCELARNWGIAQDNERDDATVLQALNLVHSSDKDIKLEIEKRQSASGGKECTIEGMEPSQMEILKKHPPLRN